MPSSSRAPLVLWLPVFAASIAGGWMAGRYAPAERLREKVEVSSPAVSVPLAAPVRMARIAPAVSQWMDRVKKAAPAEFPALFAELKTLFPDKAERHEAAVRFLFAEWLSRDADAAMAFAVLQENKALLDTAMEVMVRVQPEKAAALGMASGTGVLPQKAKNTALGDLADCRPDIYLKLDPKGTTDYWRYAVDALAKMDAAAVLRFWDGCAEPEKEEDRAALMTMLAFALGKQDPVTGRRWAEGLPDKKDRDLALNVYLCARAHKDPRAAWRELRGCELDRGPGNIRLSATGADSWTGDSRTEIAGRLAQVDFAAAMASIKDLALLFPHDEASGEPDADTVSQLRDLMITYKRDGLPKEPAALVAGLEAMARVIDPGWNGGAYPEEITSHELNCIEEMVPKDCLTAAGMRMKQEPTGESDPLLRQLLCRAVRAEPDAAIALLHDLPSSIRTNIATGILQDNSIEPEDTERVSALLEWIPPGEWDSVFPEWDKHLAACGPRLAPRVAEGGAEVRTDFARQWAEEDPAAALAWLKALPGDVTLETAGLMEGWAYYDEAEASAWAAALPSGPGRDHAADGLVRGLTGSDPDAAWEWADSIGDDTIRREALTFLAQEWKDAPEEFHEACALEGIMVNPESGDGEKSGPADPAPTP